MGENLWAIVGKMKLVLYFLIYCLGEVEFAKVQFLAERLTLTLNHKSVSCLPLRLLYDGNFCAILCTAEQLGNSDILCQT